MFQAIWEREQPLGPDEITMIDRIVTDFCRERKLATDSEEARKSAGELLKWFRAGVTDAVKLRELLYSAS
ncbi:hypothetical protein QTL95_17230 [Rhizobium sp. S152]|uniref:hypothetical protein n=1 Tax=Rhizobium sp. S152 TaxID=3055038 RepID=UPI0025A9DCE6|nr:hypothetical protein [Rhizobium sp. S152]MDM9627648.1 hypothetical protein [Rhizobium sp. S152]